MEEREKGSALESRILLGAGRSNLREAMARNLRIAGEKERNLGLRRPASLEKLPAVPSSLSASEMAAMRAAGMGGRGGGVH